MVHVLDLLLLFLVTFFLLWLVGFGVCFFTRKRSAKVRPQRDSLTSGCIAVKSVDDQVRCCRPPTNRGDLVLPEKPGAGNDEGGDGECSGGDGSGSYNCLSQTLVDSWAASPLQHPRSLESAANCGEGGTESDKD